MQSIFEFSKSFQTSFHFSLAKQHCYAGIILSSLFKKKESHFSKVPELIKCRKLDLSLVFWLWVPGSFHCTLSLVKTFGKQKIHRKCKELLLIFWKRHTWDFLSTCKRLLGCRQIENWKQMQQIFWFCPLHVLDKQVFKPFQDRKTSVTFLGGFLRP